MQRTLQPPQPPHPPGQRRRAQGLPRSAGAAPPGQHARLHRLHAGGSVRGRCTHQPTAGEGMGLEVGEGRNEQAHVGSKFAHLRASKDPCFAAGQCLRAVQAAGAGRAWLEVWSAKWQTGMRCNGTSVVRRRVPSPRQADQGAGGPPSLHHVCTRGTAQCSLHQGRGGD